MPPSGASTTCASRLSHGTALERSRGGAHPHETDEWSGGVFGIGGGVLSSGVYFKFHEFSVTRCESVRMPLASCQPFSRESCVSCVLSPDLDPAVRRPPTTVASYVSVQCRPRRYPQRRKLSSLPPDASWGPSGERRPAAGGRLAEACVQKRLHKAGRTVCPAPTPSHTILPTL
jgi:hypothetical protein